MNEVVVVSCARTAIGNFGGALKDFSAAKLGSIVIKETLKRANLRPSFKDQDQIITPDLLKNEEPTELEKKYADWDESSAPLFIDEVIMGTILQGGLGQNTARQAAIFAGISKETPAFTVNKVCGSGLKAITLAAQSIMLGQAQAVIAGGMESMSNAGYILPKARWGYRMDIDGRGELLDLLVYDGLWEVFYDCHMGLTAESLAMRCGITRLEMDNISYISQQRAVDAIKSGKFEKEIIPVAIPQRKSDPVLFKVDERPRETTMEYLAGLKPVFKKDGSITAGNASGISDGAAALLLMSADKAAQMGLKPLAKIKAWSSAALEPFLMGLGPVSAVRKLYSQTGHSNKDIDTFEINEAFAAQVACCLKELELNYDKTNLHGSGISLGHPIGATGARMAVSLIYDMIERDLKRGLQTMCIGGGMGMAAIWER